MSLLPAPSQPASKKQRIDLNTAKATANGSADAGSTTVFVGNLPWSVEEQDIRGFFEECGEIVSVRMGECLRGCGAGVRRGAGGVHGAGVVALVGDSSRAHGAGGVALLGDSSSGCPGGWLIERSSVAPTVVLVGRGCLRDEGGPGRLIQASCGMQTLGIFGGLPRYPGS